MDREVILIVMSLVLGGPLCVAFGALASPGAAFSSSGRSAENAAWWRLWLPLQPAGLALTFLLGWALREPDNSDELLHPAVLVAALPWAALVARAVLRAVRALMDRRAPLAATVGLFRPRVVIDERLADALDPEALEAVRAHEAAHARHRDPLRIWVAQLAADLQWPGSSAQRRFRQWLHALEVARDEEARETGVPGEALASAVVTTARFGNAQRLASASLVGEAEFLRDRITRLLGPVHDPVDLRRNPWVAVGLVIATCLGAYQGDVILRWLPGISG